MITPKNVHTPDYHDVVELDSLIAANSGTADLVVLGLTEQRFQEEGRSLFLHHPDLNETLFVYAHDPITIT